MPARNRPRLAIAPACATRQPAGRAGRGAGLSVLRRTFSSRFTVEVRMDEGSSPAPAPGEAPASSLRVEAGLIARGNRMPRLVMLLALLAPVALAAGCAPTAAPTAPER